MEIETNKRMSLFKNMKLKMKTIESNFVNLTFLLLVVFGCVQCASNEKKKLLTTDKQVTTQMIDFKDFDTRELDPCDTFSIEISNIYPIIDSVPRLMHDTVFLENILKNKNFQLLKAGWGNWEKGPRISESIYEKDECQCKVYKKYYSIRVPNDNREDTIQNKLRITEKIVCNALNDGGN